MFQDTRPAALDAHGAPDRWGEFRVDHPAEVLALMRQLRDATAPVNLNAPAGQMLTTTLWSVDEACRRLNFDVDAERHQLAPMIESDELVAVAYLDSVKLQFDLQDTTLVHGRRAATLQTALPRDLYRFQRRGAYRVRTLERSAPTAQLRHPSMPEMLLQLRVVDVSIGGCALFVPHDVPALQPGTQLSSVHVELDIDTHFEVGLQLQHVSSIHPDQRGVRIGCEWQQLSPAAERTLQRYIDQTQKRRRLLQLD